MATYGVQSVNCHVLLFQREDNYVIYNYVTGCQKTSAYLLNYKHLKIVTA